MNGLSVDLAELTHTILASRFPGDTGAARFRHLAVTHLIAAEVMRGNTPTLESVASSVDYPPSEIETIAKTLSERGVIEPVDETLVFTPDPIAGLYTAHRAVAGRAIKPRQ